ncbi:glycosyltransferase [Polynucleobacter sp. 73C-SIWE]|uniref:glycosyltransferase n=1 Tax=Polynucleobacter sp. 73C-SIWE TaxID=2689098 RepID=UPI001C0D7CC7|nr:glycosyltransferase [Polynucleobacter sp. 73C-SIWE]MBU3578631.1 glycosyltransferase [Polynucleobacter sp. 73C-SIWE]
MKIAQVDVNYLSSSTGKIVFDLITGLKLRGHETAAYFGRGPDQDTPNVHKISSSTEVLLHAFATRLTGLTGIYSPLATRNLIRLLTEFQPDVVHLHDLHGYFINISELVGYLKSNNIPTVWTFHSEFMYTGKCGHALDCEKWKSHCNACPNLAGYPKSWVLDFTALMFDQKQQMFEDFEHLSLVAPSSWLANRMRKSPILNGRSISVIPNGLDTEIFSPRESDILRYELGINHEYVVLSVGSDLLSEAKGGRWVLTLAERNPEMTFVMVGVKELGIPVPSNVRLVAAVYDQILLSKYYSLAKVILLTSAKETFSMVCAESLACGRPIIGFDAGAPVEVAPDGFGEFVPYGDLGALESLLRKNYHGLASMRSENECRFFATTNYSKDVMVDAYQNLYSKLTRKH